MAITAVTKVSETGSYQSTNRTYTQRWRVTADDIATTIPAILTASSGLTIPAMGAAHPADSTAKVQEKSCELEEPNSPIWIVTVSYARPSGGSGQQLEENPLDEDPVIEWGDYATEKVHDKDIYGNAIKNSAGDRYDPPITSDVHYPVVTVVRNEATYDAELAHDMRDSINSAGTTICGLYTAQYAAKLVQWNGRSATRNGISYYEHTYRIEFNPETWVWDQLVSGLYQIDGAGKHVRCKDEEKKDAVIPMYLNKTTGVQLAAGADPQYTSYHIYKLRNFAVLGLNI
jgi:hypothetical protein